MAFNKLKLVSGIAIALALTACASKEQTVTYIAGNEQSLYQTVVSDLNKNKFSHANSVLTQLSLQYPFGQYAQQVSVLQAYTDFAQKNYDLATAQINKYFTSFPNKVAPYGDYMLLIHAESSFKANRGFFQELFNMNQADNDLTDIETGLTDLRALLDLYPTSVYKEYAQNLFNFYADKVAQHNLKVAQLYLRFDDPVAAYKRANTVLINFADSAYAEQALEVLGKAASTLGLEYSAEYEAIKARLAQVTKRPLITKVPSLASYRPAFLDQESK
ncbi:outer membrane protein assembly factor BamD [Psittacicella hinzii]|uniref:Outer membrane lipoprotein BamD-like domain-containing protein n=1 Tax=Psittacicella hinzii TaxID=2028575 RepID=A0A3A1YRX1_9GAMM|nr:outer membrane protein assembly factor BamD [Psittacicella hinzii]RIY39999.1 hypothetical protein CKF58_01150 [Psittacicella hinzii]